MILVVDTNVIIAAAIRQTITQEILFNKEFQFYTPEFAKEEIEKYRSELIRKGGYTENEFEIILSLIFSRITIIPLEEYTKYKDSILKITPDEKDWPFLALAKHLNAPLWTYDSELKLKQNVVKTITTSELVKMIRFE